MTNITKIWLMETSYQARKEIQLLAGKGLGSSVASTWEMRPTMIVHLVPFKSHAILTPSGGPRLLPPWLGFSHAGTFCQFKCGALELYWGYSRRIGETDKRIALQLTQVPMLNLTAVVFTSVLGIARKPLYNYMCDYCIQTKCFSTCK